MVQASWQDDALHLSFNPPVSKPAAVWPGAWSTGGWEAPVVEGAVALPFGLSRPGQIVDLWLLPVSRGAREQRLAFARSDFVQRPPYVVYETAHGSLSVR